jgi:hypothetical protein
MSAIVVPFCSSHLRASLKMISPRDEKFTRSLLVRSSRQPKCLFKSQLPVASFTHFYREAVLCRA